MKTIQYIEDDLFAHIKNDKDAIVIPHVCNDVGAWGAGFVVPLGKYFPSAREEYLAWAHKPDAAQLGFECGETQIVLGSNSTVGTPQRFICNMVAQNGIAKMPGERPLRYNSLVKCMEKVAGLAANYKAKIVAPFFGSDLAGGDWNFIEQLIEDCWLNRDIPVTICYLPGRTPKNWKLPDTR